LTAGNARQDICLPVATAFGHLNVNESKGSLLRGVSLFP
jgi:hypothetical protein